MLIEPHSDDGIISAGGFMQKYRNHYEYHFVLIAASDIPLHHNLKMTRKERLDDYESYRNFFNGHWYHGTDNDTELPLDMDSQRDLYPRRHLVRLVETAIEEIKPDIILFAGPSFHHDHTAVYESVIAATRPTARFCPLEMYILENPTYVHATNPMTQFHPDTYVILTREQIEAKLECFRSCFPSQIRCEKKKLSLQRRYKKLGTLSRDGSKMRICRGFSDLLEKNISEARMIVTIHQPEHMPWSGYFHKMAQADLYVLLDNVQFKTNNWQNRNRIIDRQGNVQWLTVPVRHTGHMQTTIRHIEINNQTDWRRTYWGRIKDSYCRHPYFKRYSEQLQEILNRNHIWLYEINRDLIDFFRAELSVSTRLVWASDLPVSGKGTELLLSIIKAAGGTTYLSGPDGANYMDLGRFKEESVQVVFHEFTPPVYKGMNGFIPAASTLDLLMNFGEKTAERIGIKPANQPV